MYITYIFEKWVFKKGRISGEAEWLLRLLAHWGLEDKMTHASMPRHPDAPPTTADLQIVTKLSMQWKHLAPLNKTTRTPDWVSR